MNNIQKFLGECSDCVYTPCLSKEKRRDYKLSVIVTSIALSILTFPVFLAVSLIRGYFKNKNVKNLTPDNRTPPKEEPVPIPQTPNDTKPTQNESEPILSVFTDEASKKFKIDLNHPGMILGRLPEEQRSDFEKTLKEHYKAQGLPETDPKYIIKLPASLTPKRTIEERVEQFNAANPLSFEEEIESFVNKFLHHYITGSVNAANEPANRTPMITELRDKFNVSVEDQKRVDDIAVSFYIKFAIQAYFTQTRSQKLDFEKLNPGIFIAIKKDFPEYQITDEQLKSKIFESFVVNFLCLDLSILIRPENEYGVKAPMLTILRKLIETKLEKENKLKEKEDQKEVDRQALILYAYHAAQAYMRYIPREHINESETHAAVAIAVKKDFPEINSAEFTWAPKVAVK